MKPVGSMWLLIQDGNIVGAVQSEASADWWVKRAPKQDRKFKKIPVYAP